MINPFQTGFGAIFRNEVLLNTKRIAPYALMIVFSATALMGWRKGPAVALGWATNSDFYIARSLKAFSFLLGLPIFTAVIMGDPVIRDFRLGIDPLIFSKPLSRAQYLLGKFCGNFFVLVCCMAAFPLTMLVLQAFRQSQMIVQPVKVFPYFKHFFFFVVITHLAFAAIYFTVGTLTRNNKIVYLLAVCFYPIYIFSMVFLLRSLTVRGRSFLDPFLLDSGPSNNGFGNGADYLNQYVFSYTPDMIWNRVLVILLAGVCLTWLYLRFTSAELSKKTSPSGVSLGISTAIENANYDSETFPETRREQPEKAALREGIKMKSPFSTPFGAIFQNEVRLNSRRVAPYVVAALCAGNAVLWWGWGPATGRGVAVNSDFFIAGVLPVYSFLFLPLYTALMMADPGIRDFRNGIDPLIFSKPISRGEYLLGKFFGNFFVLACCQSAFSLTLFVLQWVPKKGVTVLPETNFLAYPKHFLIFVAISHMFLAAVYFTVGTLARNAKIVYGLGIAFYPIYIAYQKVLLSSLPWRSKLALDPLVMNRALVPNSIQRSDPSWLNQLVIVYDADLIVNRVVMILLTAICLTIVYLRFTIAERPQKVEELSVLNLTSGAGGFYYDPPSADLTIGERFEPDHLREKVLLPGVTRATAGIGSHLRQLFAALGVEFRLLLSERSLIVIMPLAVFLSTLDVAFWSVTPDPSFSAAYAGHTARSLLLFMLGITIFFTGEAMHRDRNLRIEPLIWSQPIPNYVLLLSKFLTTLLLTLTLILVVALITITLQSVKHNIPIELSAYLRTCCIILIPNAIFLAAAAVALNVLLRDRYLTYAAAIGTCAGLFYLYSQGHNHWLYNPLLFQLWDYADLFGGATHSHIIWNRLYIVALAGSFLLFAHLSYPRRAVGKSFRFHREDTDQRRVE